MKRKTVWLTAAVLTLALAGCKEAATPAPAPSTAAGTTYTVDEGIMVWTSNPGPGDTVNVRMQPTGDPQSRCEDMGGTLDADNLCRDIDF